MENNLEPNGVSRVNDAAGDSPLADDANSGTPKRSADGLKSRLSSVAADKPKRPSEFKIADKPLLNKEQILQTNNWIEQNYTYAHNTFIWKHKTLEEHGYYIELHFYPNDGNTIVKENGNNARDYPQLFDVYVKTIDEFNILIHLLRLKEL